MGETSRKNQKTPFAHIIPAPELQVESYGHEDFSETLAIVLVLELLSW